MVLKIAMVGFGKQSKEDHLPAVIQSENYELVAVCDTDFEIVGVISDQYGVSGYTDLEELLKAEDFQVALVSVPHHAYVNVVSTLVSAKKHIIKEKPFATSIAEAQQLLRILEKGQTFLGVTVQRRFNPIYQTFHQLKKHIGKIYSIEGAYTMNTPSLEAGWRASRELSGGGALADMGYHFIDLLVWYFGMPTTVTARMSRGNRPNQSYDVEDTAHLLFDYCFNSQYDEKLVGNFVISRVYPEKQEYVRVLSTKGIVEVSRGMIRLLGLEGKEIERLERQTSWPTAAVEQLDYFAAKIRNFVSNDVPDYTEHLQHVAVIEAAYESDRLRTSCNPIDFLKRLINPKERG